MTDKISREISIQAPIATVWEVITKPEYINQWFCKQTEIDLRQGGKGKLSWGEDFEAPLEIVEVDKPHLFSFLWVAPDEETKPTRQQTLVEFRLTEDGAQTKVYLTESGFEKLEITVEQKASLIANHTPGWDEFLSSLQRCAQNIPTKA
ncbi:MAG TPA: SRPBCC domain-containing protein [Ktedonobacteraceae bacterium]